MKNTQSTNMKASLAIFCSIIFLLACVPVANAQFNYTNVAGAVTVTGYTGPGGTVTIPGTIGGLPVTQIGDEAFYGNTNVTSVTIPYGVLNIGNESFYGCLNLTDVTIPDTVTNLAQDSFEDCGLITLTIPNSVTTIEGAAFDGCSRLTSVTIPYGVSALPGPVFAGCVSLTNVTIPDSVTDIGFEAFEQCSSLANIVIPNSVTSIDAGAFELCTSLTNIVIPNGVTYLQQEVFSRCTNLTSVTIPNSVTVIGLAAFEGCAALTNVTIPGSVTTIGLAAFNGCSLTSVTIPDSVTIIDLAAFNGCAFTNITIPAGVKTFSAAFAGCSQLVAITVSPQNPYYQSSGGVVFDRSGETLLDFPAGLTGGYAVPNGVVFIGADAFASSSLADISIADSVTSIGDDAFGGCSNLTNAVIPNSVRDIGEEAFGDCTSLANISIPHSVTSIGTYAFSGCGSLTNIIIPGSVGTLPQGMLSYCSNLTDVAISSGVTTIGGAVFANCNSLTNLIIPKSVTTISNRAFEAMDNFAGIYFMGDAPTIASPLFSGWLTNPIVYYFSGTRGWGSKFDGHPTVMLKPPMVTITTPRSRGSVSNANFIVSGLVSTQPSITNILFQLNGGGWNPATLLGSGGDWTASVTLTPGTNTVSIYATDTFGNVSPVESVAFTYVVAAPLTVLTNGDGNATPDYNNALLQIGKTYTMTDKPGKGCGFVNWTGSIVTNSPRLTFIMASNLTFTANFRDTSRPVNAILSPRKNQIVTNAPVVATGKARDNVGVTAVWFTVNGGAWLAADLTGGTNWLTPDLSPSLVSGQNTVSAYALDAAGNASLTNTLHFRYLVP